MWFLLKKWTRPKRSGYAEINLAGSTFRTGYMNTISRTSPLGYRTFMTSPLAAASSNQLKSRIALSTVAVVFVLFLCLSDWSCSAVISLMLIENRVVPGGWAMFSQSLSRLFRRALRKDGTGRRGCCFDWRFDTSDTLGDRCDACKTVSYHRVHSIHLRSRTLHIP